MVLFLMSPSNGRFAVTTDHSFDHPRFMLPIVASPVDKIKQFGELQSMATAPAP